MQNNICRKNKKSEKTPKCGAVRATPTNILADREEKLVREPFVHNSATGQPPKCKEPIGEGITFNEETKISLASNKVQTLETTREDKMGDKEIKGPRQQGLVTFEFPI